MTKSSKERAKKQKTICCFDSKTSHFDSSRPYPYRPPLSKLIGLARRPRRGPSQPPLRPRLPRRRGRRGRRRRGLQGHPARDPSCPSARRLLRLTLGLPFARQPQGHHRRRALHRGGAGDRGEHRVDPGLPQEDLLGRVRERGRMRRWF